MAKHGDYMEKWRKHKLMKWRKHPIEKTGLISSAGSMPHHEPYLCTICTTKPYNETGC
jgi:hypothetical protein